MSDDKQPVYSYEATICVPHPNETLERGQCLEMLKAINTAHGWTPGGEVPPDVRSAHYAVAAGREQTVTIDVFANGTRKVRTAVESAEGPTTHNAPTGACDYDIVCDGCGEVVADPHSWAECCAAQKKMVASLRDKLLSGPGTENVCGLYVCRNCGNEGVHSWEYCAIECRQERDVLSNELAMKENQRRSLFPSGDQDDEHHHESGTP
jgi:hypothetical protein